MNIGITVLIILVVPLLFQVFNLSMKVNRMQREMNAHFSKIEEHLKIKENIMV